MYFSFRFRDPKGRLDSKDGFGEVSPTRSKTRAWLARRDDVAPTEWALEDLKLLEKELKLREEPLIYNCVFIVIYF